MTNLVDLSTYPPQHRCPCGTVVRHVNGAWTDGAGVVHCQGGAPHVGAPVIARSALLDPMPAILRGCDAE